MSRAELCPVSKLEKLFLATDGSPYSEGAVKEAISFAKRCSSKLYAMSVIEIITDYEAFSPQKIEDTLALRAKKHLESVKAMALTEGVDCETIVTFSEDPYLSIVEEVEKRQADMIIIGRRGRTGLKKVLMGEIATNVIGHAPCKVLVVPRDAEIKYRNILVATDGSSHSETAVLEAIGIAKRCGSSIIALSSIRSESEMEEAKANVNKVANLARKEGIPVETLIPMGRSYDTIVEIAGSGSVDLIVMGTYGKSGLKKFLMGSSTEKVIGKAGCAVLVVRGEGEKPATV